MKILVVCLSLFLSLEAIATPSVNDVIKKVDRRLKDISTSENNLKIPWEVVDARESRLWATIVDGYDHLKSYGLSERYNFMYEAMRATSLGHPERINALRAWLEKENTRFLLKGLRPEFYPRWKIHTQRIFAAIDDISKARPVPVINNGTSKFLQKIKNDLTKINAENPPSFYETYAIPLLGCSSLLLLCLGFFIGKKRNSAPATSTITPVLESSISAMPGIPEGFLDTELPALPDEAFDKPLEKNVNLEEACRTLFETQSELLKASHLNVLSPVRSPFKTNINASSEKVSEAIEWLLKGTLAMVKSSSTKATHMEWNCKEISGRLSLEFVVHGMECDYKALYLNTLKEGAGSAPAHFGRSEMALSEHLPSVIFQSAQKMTIVSLGLDAVGHSMDH
jgi:hypothetical protein